MKTVIGGGIAYTARIAFFIRKEGTLFSFRLALVRRGGHGVAVCKYSAAVAVKSVAKLL